ncbi:sulfotransferase domain-containing protein [Methylomonas methanica]|uniref:Sulfotransferase n=1 Tax=Methylomonas methanica (strain DSM 25384 / MC09) TaxID=857087 RepID=F9ZW68_METMM|nr:sulfotransferase domain-containing protein [Methylomonas methanica]AEG02039.1 sulfotransferase [Methylomonas methanica MC09]
MDTEAGTRHLNNLIEADKAAKMFRNPKYRFEVSSRLITPNIDPFDYLKYVFWYLEPEQIESVFGNTLYPSRFYGGRSFDLEHSLTDQHVRILNDNGKGVTLTLTGHHFSDAVYNSNRHFFEKFHKDGNAVVCTNDTLARRIKADFPRYTTKASLIKHLNTAEMVHAALELYDFAVIPMDKNDDDDFLNSLEEKHRVILFGNANCAYNCPARTCYAAISQANWEREKTSKCSKNWLPRPEIGHQFFDVDKFYAMGFRHFKLVPAPANHAVELLIKKSNSTPIESAAARASAAIYSFPKCGRTWLRFLLGHYLNLYFKLEIPVNLQTLFTLLPNNHAGLKGIEHYQFSHIPELPLIVSSHGTDRSIPGILLLRAIPDVVVSDYFQQQKLAGNTGTLSEFIANDRGSLTRYCHYLNTWAKNGNHKRHHVLTYEMLHLDTKSELSNILRRIGVPVADELVQQAVHLSSFEKMQEIEIAFGHAGLMPADGDKEMLKVRKGKVGGYADYLSQDEIDNLFSRANEILSEQTKRMLDENGIGTRAAQQTLNPYIAS